MHDLLVDLTRHITIEHSTVIQDEIIRSAWIHVKHPAQDHKKIIPKSFEAWIHVKHSAHRTGVILNHKPHAKKHNNNALISPFDSLVLVLFYRKDYHLRRLGSKFIDKSP